MNAPDLDHLDRLIRDNAPSVHVPVGTDQAMAATARSLTHGAAGRSVRMRRTLRPVLAFTAVAAACAVAAAVHTHSQPTPVDAAGSPSTPTATPTARTTPLEEQSRFLDAPWALPLPDGVTHTDATAFVADVVEANPSLTEAGAYVLDAGAVVHVKTVQGSVVSAAPAQETGVSAAYVFYARCQWQRAVLAGDVTEDAGLTALGQLSDSSAYSMDGDVLVFAPDHEGIGVSPAGADGLGDEFARDCTGAWGASPKSTR